MNDILIVIDCQNDFITGSLGSLEAQGIIPNVVKLVEEYLEANKKVIFTLDTHSDNYLSTYEGLHLPIKHCIRGTDGYRLPEDLKHFLRYENVAAIRKSTFGYPRWKQYLTDNWYPYPTNGIQICGLVTSICVATNALLLKTAYPDINITIDPTTTADTPENKAAALRVLRMNQIIIKEN